MSAITKRKLAHWQDWRMYHDFMWWWDTYMAQLDYQLAMNHRNTVAVARLGCSLEWGQWLRNATENALAWYYEQNTPPDPHAYIHNQVRVHDSALSAYVTIFEAYMGDKVISIEYDKLSLKNVVSDVSRGIFLEGINPITRDALSFPLSIIEPA